MYRYMKTLRQLIPLLIAVGGLSWAEAGERLSPQAIGEDLLPAEQLQLYHEQFEQNLEQLEAYRVPGQIDRRHRERERRRRERCRRTGQCRRPVPPPRRPMPNPGYMCFATNEFGQSFRGYDRFSAYWAQERAMGHCRPFSRFCRPAGCRRVY